MSERIECASPFMPLPARDSPCAWRLGNAARVCVCGPNRRVDRGTPGNYRATFIRGYPWTWQVNPTTKSLGLFTLSIPFVRIGTDPAQPQRFC